MIQQDIYIKEYDWVLHAYFSIHEYHVEEIMDLLWELDCDAHNAKRAYDNMISGELNTGFCYSNYAKRESVMLVAKASSAPQFLNSLLHELTHFQSHVAKVYFLKPTDEEVAYMAGDIIQQLYPKIKHLLCECCRNKNKTKQYYDYEREN